MSTGRLIDALLYALCIGGGLLSTSFPAVADDDEEETFASIAKRAASLSSDIAERSPAVVVVVSKTGDDRIAYDFSVPMYGEDVPLKKIVHQEYDGEGSAKLKAILVVNMKEDDPVARKDIPEFIALAAKYVVARSSKVAYVSHLVNSFCCLVFLCSLQVWSLGRVCGRHVTN